MPAFDVVVVGAGAAGTAAAWAAARAGARVSVLHDRAGATALYSGALDLVPWDSKDEPEARQAAEAAVLADAELAAFASELGILRLGHCMLASREGVARRALGSDRALLDLEPLAGKRVGVLDAERDDWDAALLAKSLSASPFAERTRTSFVPIPVRMLSAGHERRVAAYDFAALHDDPARLSALGEALRAERAAADAWLSGPWLGLERDSARELAALAGAPVGETTSKVGGPAGARFERARDRLLQRRGVEVRQARVSRVSGASGALFVALEGAEGTREVEAKAVVLASGGVAAGGIVLRWDPELGGRGFELAFEAPVELELDGERLAGFGSLNGPSFRGGSLAVLERVGIAVDPARNPRAIGFDGGGLTAAGDCVAGRPRTVLQAVQDGLAAGVVAARD